MSVFKCKMCGGALEISGKTVAVCQYCGTEQTLPKLDDDRKANLYDRANHFRRNNEFDKAMGIFEQVLNDDPGDAETYWSIVLCRYGIEYVEDPTTHKRVPTINRAQFTSVFDDEDYKSALRYADSAQKGIYEQEAALINDIQKSILAISSQEDPFDVFICYKESDNNGRRTPDSVLATELYHELTREGYKVFFSRITLEDKLGTAYEPYIFAALNSAKVMVVLGTKPEHFTAVWVKNEWSRYLALIKNGAKKMLIPAYKDFDPYDLPEEFSHLQAQDMSKLGFMQDLVRGIRKIVESTTPTQVVHETIISKETTSGNVTALLKRGFMALEDGEWSRADDFFEQALNQNAELAEAYLGKLMADLQIRSESDLKNCAAPFDSNGNYLKVIRFANPKLKNDLVAAIQFITDRNEAAERDEIYNKACNLMNLNNMGAYYEAAQWFKKIPGHKDADSRAIECQEKEGVARKDSIYRSACAVLDDSHQWSGKKTDLKAHEEAIEKFQSLNGWKDSDAKILLCQKRIEEIVALLEKERLEQEQKKLEAERQAEIDKARKEKDLKLRKKVGIILAIIALLAIISIIIISALEPHFQYQQAVSLMSEGNYKEAKEIFGDLWNYKDSKDQYEACIVGIKENMYAEAVDLMNAEQYDEAITAFRALGDFKDSKDKLEECTTIPLNKQYDEAIALMSNAEYSDAISIFKKLGDFKDSKAKIEECSTCILDQKYDAALTLKNNGEYLKAIAGFAEILDHKDSAQQHKDAFIQFYGQTLYDMQGIWHTTGGFCRSIKIEGTTVYWKYHDDTSYKNENTMHGHQVSDMIEATGEWGSTTRKTFKLKDGNIIYTYYYNDGTSESETYYRTDTEITTNKCY